MAPPQEIVQALNVDFPKPRVDPVWLEECCTWIVEEMQLSPTADFQEFLQHVNDQILNSDLKDSMHHGTGLNDISRFSGNLHGLPVLVQITNINDMGVSAFQLEQIRVAREERTLAGLGDEEGEEDGDVEVEGEGPMPKYPRGTLHLRLSDGATEFEAMEYRPISQLVLGVTKLGYKMQLHGTRFSNGMAFLEPATIKLVGGHSEDLHKNWADDFKRDLQGRMSRPFQDALIHAGPVQVPEFPRASRAPLRDISPPPPTLHDDDVDMEPRRRLPNTSSVPVQPSSASISPRVIKPLPSRQSRRSTGMTDNVSMVTDKMEGFGTSPHFNSNPSGSGRTSHNEADMAVEDFDFRFSPTTRQLTDTLAPSPFPSQAQNTSGQRQRNSFDFDLLEEVDNSENMPPWLSNDKGGGRALNHTSSQQRYPADDNNSDYGMEDDMFADTNFLESLDRAEKEALKSSSSTGSASKGASSGGSRSHSIPVVIDLVDDSEEDANKENAFVPMRHTRRRTEDSPRGRSPTTTQIRYSNQKKGVISINPDDIIDISDSD